MDILDYYKSYFDQGGVYTMAAVDGTSRVTQLVDWLKVETKPGDKILDVGCGDMLLSTKLPDREWLGLDINVSRARGKALVFDAMKPPYPVEAGSFDAVVSSEFLEHIWDMRVVHNEVHRVLKPNGLYLISTPNFNWIENILSRHSMIVYDPERPWTMEHIRHYTPEVHEKHLKDAGFVLEDWTGLDAHYGSFFQGARRALKFILTKECKAEQYQDDARIDIALGRMFSEISASIAFMSRKKG